MAARFSCSPITMILVGNQSFHQVLRYAKVRRRGGRGFLRKKSLVFANFTNHWGMLLNCFFYIVSAKGKIHKKENDNKKYLPALRLYLCDRTGAI